MLGDASSFVDPLSSFGVKKALASAWLGSVAVHTALVDTRCGAAAVELFAERERAMYDHLQRQSALLSRDAAEAHDSGFWVGRSDVVERGEASWMSPRSATTRACSRRSRRCGSKNPYNFALVIRSHSPSARRCAAIASCCRNIS